MHLTRSTSASSLIRQRHCCCLTAPLSDKQLIRDNSEDGQLPASAVNTVENSHSERWQLCHTLPSHASPDCNYTTYKHDARRFSRDHECDQQTDKEIDHNLHHNWTRRAFSRAHTSPTDLDLPKFNHLVPCGQGYYAWCNSVPCVRSGWPSRQFFTVKRPSFCLTSNREIWQLMGRITETFIAVAIDNMATMNAGRETNVPLTLMHGRKKVKLI